MRHFAFVCALLGATMPAFAGTFFNATLPADNPATLAAFRAASGFATPEHFVDFESLTTGENVSGNSALFPIMTLTSSNGNALISEGAGAIGGSNPIDTKAVEMSESADVTLSFSTPIMSIGGYSIDQSNINLVIRFVGGGVQNFVITGTAASGNSAEFWGFVADQGDGLIESVEFTNVGGVSGWGLDNLEYNAVPEPMTMIALGAGAAALIRRRRRA